LVGGALLSSAGTIAKDNNKSTLTITITEKVNVEGKTLDPDKYKVEWTGTGPTVQVIVLRGKDTVATFPAHLTEPASQNPRDAYGTTQRPDGSLALTTLFPGGQKFILQGEHIPSATQQAGTQRSN
jgi:hypothetical protein